MLNLGCEQVMRFLGKRLNGRFDGEVVSDLRRGPERVPLKHWVNQNSIKLLASPHKLNRSLPIISRIAVQRTQRATGVSDPECAHLTSGNAISRKFSFGGR